MYKTQHQNKPLLQQTHNKDKTFRFYNKESLFQSTLFYFFQLSLHIHQLKPCFHNLFETTAQLPLLQWRRKSSPYIEDMLKESNQ